MCAGRRAPAFGGGGREAARRAGPISGRPVLEVVLRLVPPYVCGLFSVSLCLRGLVRATVQKRIFVQPRNRIPAARGVRREGSRVARALRFVPSVRCSD